MDLLAFYFISDIFAILYSYIVYYIFFVSFLLVKEIIIYQAYL